jgi:hypothetical protein
MFALELEGSQQHRTLDDLEEGVVDEVLLAAAGRQLGYYRFLRPLRPLTTVVAASTTKEEEDREHLQNKRFKPVTVENGRWKEA